jgi:hypothetical protein
MTDALSELTARVEERDRIEDAAFKVWQDLQAVAFDVLMANRYAGRDYLTNVRERLEKAVERIDDALSPTYPSADIEDRVRAIVRGGK